MAGGHGEWFVQDFGCDGLPEAEVVSMTPDAAKLILRNAIAAGSKAGELMGSRGADTIALDILPDARFTHLLPPALLTAALTPIYGRPPDARLPGAA